jgi:hypothetical protein
MVNAEAFELGRNVPYTVGRLRRGGELQFVAADCRKDAFDLVISI